jgi:hypothetical protein
VLVKEYAEQGHKVLRLQKKLEKAKGEALDRLIRDMQVEIKKGQVMAQVVKARNFKSTRLNLNFFFQ